jgi:hypothetical protein
VFAKLACVNYKFRMPEAAPFRSVLFPLGMGLLSATINAAQGESGFSNTCRSLALEVAKAPFMPPCDGHQAVTSYKHALTSGVANKQRKVPTSGKLESPDKKV